MQLWKVAKWNLLPVGSFKFNMNEVALWKFGIGWYYGTSSHRGKCLVVFLDLIDIKKSTEAKTWRLG